MDIRIFPEEELPVALGAVRAVDAVPTREQDRFLRVIGRLHGVAITPGRLPAPTPAQTAAAITDPHRRKRLLQLAVVMTMIDGKVWRSPVARVAELSRALEIEERAVRTLVDLAAEHRLLVRADLMRRIMGRFVSDAWHDEGLDGVQKMIAPLFFHRGGDAELARRYQQLGSLPEGSFGRTLWVHNRTRGFAFPGEEGGIP